MRRKRRKGLRKAAREFSKWNGPARIYHDTSTGEVWTNLYSGPKTSKSLYQGDPDVIRVYTKCPDYPEEKLSAKDLKAFLDSRTDPRSKRVFRK